MKTFQNLTDLVYPYLFDVKYYVSIFNLDITQWQKHIFIKIRNTFNSSISHEIDIIIEFWLEKKLHFVVRIRAYSIESWLILFSCFQCFCCKVSPVNAWWWSGSLWFPTYNALPPKNGDKVFVLHSLIFIWSLFMQ